MTITSKSQESCVIDASVALHLAGDLVLTPDHAAIHKRASEIRDAHRICCYNQFESTCRTWLIAVRSGKYSGRCCLQHNTECSGYKRRREIGLMSKSYNVDYAVYRRAASAVHHLTRQHKVLADERCNKKLQKLKKHYKKNGQPTKALQRALDRRNTKLIFFTLTFPPFKKSHKLTKSIFENEIINVYFSRFIENLRTNYGCAGYVASREFGEDNNRVHFHVLASIPFIDFRSLNDSWCNTIQDICERSKNAFTTKKGYAEIKSVYRAIRYVCKYISKSKGSQSTARLIFISNNLIRSPLRLDTRIEDLLKGYKGIEIYKTSDYSTLFRVHNPESFKKFCENIIYPVFFPENYTGFP